MIDLRAIIIALVLAVSSQASAEGAVYAGAGVYKPTVQRWAKATASASFNSTSWIWNIGPRDSKHKNKHRDTILMVPDSSYPEDITLVIWFHGLGGFGQRTFSKRLVPQLETIVEDGHSVAIAIPEMPWSTNTSTPRKRQGQVWKRPGELEKYTRNLREHLEIWSLIKYGKSLGTVRIVFVGHSAGGSALRSAAREGSLCRLNPEAVIWSDASYGYWLDGAWKGCLKTCETQLHILVRKWDKPHKNAKRFMKRKSLLRPDPPESTPIISFQVLDRGYWRHSRIGDKALSLSEIFPPGC